MKLTAIFSGWATTKKNYNSQVNASPSKVVTVKRTRYPRLWPGSTPSRQVAGHASFLSDGMLSGNWAFTFNP